MSKADTIQSRPRDITMRFLAEPTDVNFDGKVHGGAVMKWIDGGADTVPAMRKEQEDEFPL
jgi:acyl-CoA hydrolase